MPEGTAPRDPAGTSLLNPALEAQVARWREYLRHRQAIHAVDIAELEDHLREQVAGLMDGGLAADEAFLVAVKRLGAVDALSREFAREHADRLWKQLMAFPDDRIEGPDGARRTRTEALVAFAFALLAGLLVKLPELFGVNPDTDDIFYARNLALFVLPPLAAFFAWKRRLAAGTVRALALAFAAALVVANAYPLSAKADTLTLQAMHLPIALWLLVGVAYAGGRWREGSGRMDFVRHTGEQFIYFVLIALGGGALMGTSVAIFQAIGIDLEPVLQSWIAPCGAAGAMIVSAWLVEAKQSVIENMAPVLTRLFTPLFAVALLVFLGALAWSGQGFRADRDLLIAFDLVLVLVLALLLYATSARDPRAPRSLFDGVQLVLLLAALAADAVALGTMAARIDALGFTPNRTAALGLNLVLLVNLAWSAVLSVRFLRGRGPVAALERWQVAYLPVYGVWAAVVAVAFPPLFGFR
jgi:hypothetical protein